MKVTKLILLMLALSGASANAADGDRWNVMIDPLAFVIGPNASLDYRLNDHWTFGPNLLAGDLNIGDVKIQAFEGGLGATYYFDPAFTSGWFVRGNAGYNHLKIARTKVDDQSSTESSAINVNAIGGYHWFWGHFNLRVGAGLGGNFARQIKAYNSSGDRVDRTLAPVTVSGEASLGWTF